MFFELQHSGKADEFFYIEGCDMDFPAHIHRSFEFFMTTDGAAEVTVDGRAHLLTKGRAALIFPYCVHSYRPHPHSRHVMCIFSPELVSEYYNLRNGCVPADCSFAYSERFTPRAANRYLQKAYAYSICGTFDAGAEYLPANVSEKQTLLTRMLSFAEENFSTGATLGELSSQLAYDYVYLSKFFKRATGLPYHSYILRLRVETACEYLTGSTLSVEEIAARCGFGSLRSLDREFRRQKLTTPREFRRATRAARLL